VLVPSSTILLCEKHDHSEGEGNYQAKGGLYLRHAFRSARNLSAAIPDIVVRWKRARGMGNRQEFIDLINKGGEWRCPG
jgi:hypothetical protein